MDEVIKKIQVFFFFLSEKSATTNGSDEMFGTLQRIGQNDTRELWKMGSLTPHGDPGGGGGLSTDQEVLWVRFPVAAGSSHTKDVKNGSGPYLHSSHDELGTRKHNLSSQCNYNVTGWVGMLACGRMTCYPSWVIEKL